MAPSSSSSSSSSMRSHASRKRKSTFVVRKEEKARLTRELARLQAQLTAATHEASASQPMAAVLSRRERMASELRDRHLLFTGLRSVLSSYFATQRLTASFEPIHLPRDAHVRRQTLLRVSQRKIRDARLVLLARCRHVDLSQPHSSNEWFEGDNGELCLQQFDVTPLRCPCSIRQVYEAIGFCAQNVEILVSERIGDLTLREDDDTDESSGGGVRVSQRRILSNTGFGITIDANVALFRQHIAKGVCEELLDEHALLTTQSIETDALYPYVPNERVRHDMDSAVLVQQIPSPHNDHDFVTTIVRMSTIKRHPSGSVTMNVDNTRTTTRLLAMQWGDLLLQAVCERVEHDVATQAKAI